MENEVQEMQSTAFDENEWIRLVFLLSDTRQWINEMAMQALLQAPVKDPKKLLRKTYLFSVTALAHIIERHYYKISRHPHTSKFTIPLTAVLQYIRDASGLEAMPIAGSLNFQRILNAGSIIGYDAGQVPTSYITILTDSGGRIVTAFPGNKVYHSKLSAI